jgi:hypothetical protein
VLARNAFVIVRMFPTLCFMAFIPLGRFRPSSSIHDHGGGLLVWPDRSRLHEPGDGFQGRGLAGPVRTNERHEFTGTHMERYPFENMDIAVITMDTPET